MSSSAPFAISQDTTVTPLKEHHIITLCMYCRRVKVSSQPERWAINTAYLVHTPPNTSHGLCPQCDQLHHARDGAAKNPESDHE